MPACQITPAPRSDSIVMGDQTWRVATATSDRSGAAKRMAEPRLLERTPVVLVLGVALSFALSWARLVDTWKHDTFVDTDDAMRLVQVRNWLGGQGWFDLVEHRLDPPAGLLMHWSRIVDVPLGASIRLLSAFTTPDRAERLTRIAFPLALQVALLAVTVAFARMLLGVRAMLPSMILIVLSGFMFGQFPPGRIDHHAPQITLLMAMTGTLLSALEPGRARHAALSGACVALSLGISLENLPFMAVLVLVLPLAWARDPAGTRPALVWFSASLAMAASVVFVATIPPWRYGVVVTDAFSVAHWAAVLAGAAGLLLLALVTDRLPQGRQRMVLLGGVAAGVALVLLAVAPALLRGPYAGMDPLLRSIWLDHVNEAQPLLAAAKERPDVFAVVFFPLFFGACGAGIASWRTQRCARLRWMTLTGLILVGLLGTFWEVRVASSTQPLAIMGGVWTVCACLAAARRRGSVLGRGLACLLVLPFGTLAWAFVPIDEGDGSVAAALAQGQACRTETALAPIAALPPGLIFAPIDDGAHLLVGTPHSVSAAPYHRNVHGNRRVIDGFLASPAAAEAIVREAGARYVAICPGEGQIATMAAASPHGLGARLTAGDSPPWLVAMPLRGTPYRVFALAPPVR